MTTEVQVLTAKELLAQQRLRAATATMARAKAKDKIKQQIRARGGKVSNYSFKELSQLADEYLSAHREELMPQAAAMAEQIVRKLWPKSVIRKV